MIKGDMEKKRERAINKVRDAINMHGGTTLLSTGITGDDARMARAAVAAGARLLEPNHPAVILARGLYGARDMNAAEAVRHRLPLEEMLKVISGVRSAVGEEIFITVGVPGGFTEKEPIILEDEDIYNIARAGADGLHTHKATLEDLEEWVAKAHKFGLLVDAYIAHPGDRHLLGIPAGTPEEVGKVAQAMEQMGVDMIGLMTGMTYEGVSAGEIHPQVKERLEALVNSVKKAPTLAEGGINLANYQAFKGTGVNIIVVGTSFDQLAANAVSDAVKQYLSLGERFL